MSLSEKKTALRKSAFAARATAHGTGLDMCAQDLLLAEIGDASDHIIAGYMPMRTEIDPLPVMAELAKASRICVPVIEANGQPLKFREWRADATMVDGAFGARVPDAGDWLEPSILIVPLVAFDTDCNRLGYGGGFYDRTLEGLRARRPTRAIGFAYLAQCMQGLVVEPTDQLLDAVVTETQVFHPLSALAQPPKKSI